MQAIAITIGSHHGQLWARARTQSERQGLIQLLDFVRIGPVIGRIVRVEDGHDFPSDADIARIAARCLESGKDPEEGVDAKLYKRLVIEPLGEIVPGGELSEYTGGIGYFETVYSATPDEIAQLYPCDNGLEIGCVSSGAKTTSVPFRLSLDGALSRHLAVFGKNGSGKTNFLKELIAANLGQKQPIGTLVFGHPDLGADNPNDKGTCGVGLLGDERLVTVGYDRPIQLSPQELSLADIFAQFPDMSTSMRDLWHHVHTKEPVQYVQILAQYDLTTDPHSLQRKTVKDTQTKKSQTTGVATVPTIDAVCKQARILNNYIDGSAPPIISQILADLKRGKTVLVNTFNMTEYYQSLFVRLLLARLQRSGKHAMHRRICQRVLVVIDEAQHFIKRSGEEIAEFVRECRKFGITLLLSTQSPRLIPDSVYGQIYSTIAFHLNRADAQALVEAAPTLSEAKSLIQRPPLKRTLGIAVVQAMDYPYPAVIRVPRFERRIDTLQEV